MNNQRIKLALTVDLINSSPTNNIPGFIKEAMLRFKEVGSFLGFRQIAKSVINKTHIKDIYAFHFENCRLDVEMISNPITRSQYVQGFELNKA